MNYWLRLGIIVQANVLR